MALSPKVQRNIIEALMQACMQVQDPKTKEEFQTQASWKRVLPHLYLCQLIHKLVLSDSTLHIFSQVGTQSLIAASEQLSFPCIV